MLRLELEIALLEGSLAVKDLPQAWNARMEEYLGIVPPNDTKGVLQDVHWSAGLVGYFPTYALGNLVSAQLWDCIQRDLPNLEDQIGAGKFDELLAWLRENIHRHGAKFEPQELVQRVTGSKIDPEPYVRYLTEKFTKIYAL
jgi:carboxypeptidase Taq